MMSSAQVSLATTCPPASLPSTRGRKPRGVAHREHGVAHGQHQGVGALQEAQRVADLGHHRPVPGARDKMHDRLGVRRALEYCALVHELGLDHVGVGEVAVVHDREVAFGVAHDDGLRVGPLSAARCGVADVAERRVAGKRRDPPGVEDVGHEADFLVQPRAPSVGRADPRRLLAAVLQRVQREKGELRSVVDAADSHDAALLARTVVEEG